MIYIWIKLDFDATWKHLIVTLIRLLIRSTDVTMVADCIYVLEAIVSPHFSMSAVPNQGNINALEISIWSTKTNVRLDRSNNWPCGYYLVWSCRWYHFGWEIVATQKAPTNGLTLISNGHHRNMSDNFNSWSQCNILVHVMDWDRIIHKWNNTNMTKERTSHSLCEWPSFTKIQLATLT